MLKKISTFAAVAADILKEIFKTFRRQSMKKGYLIAVAIFWIAVLFVFLSLSPALYSFIYPLF
jgi:hypothetical protein